jgi:hypothetical protein
MLSATSLSRHIPTTWASQCWELSCLSQTHAGLGLHRSAGHCCSAHMPHTMALSGARAICQSPGLHTPPSAPNKAWTRSLVQTHSAAVAMWTGPRLRMRPSPAWPSSADGQVRRRSPASPATLPVLVTRQARAPSPARFRARQPGCPGPVEIARPPADAAPAMWPAAPGSPPCPLVAWRGALPSAGPACADAAPTLVPPPDPA